MGQKPPVEVIIKKRKLDPEKINAAKELTPEEWRAVALKGERLAQGRTHTQTLEFDEWA